MTSWLSGGFEPYNTQKHHGVMLSISSNCYDALILVTISSPVVSLSPAVNLLVEVVIALVELLDICFLPLNVGAVLLEFGGHIVTAAFGRTKVLLCLSDE